MHTLEPPIFCIPKMLCGEPSPVSTQNELTSCLYPKVSVPLGFCCGGFSSTAGYVPGNEARPSFDCERLSTQSADHFRRALLVFIRVTQSIFRRLSASLSASVKGGRSDRDSALDCRRMVRHRVRSLFPLPVKIPVSNFDYGWSLHPKFRMSRRKYFRFGPLFTGSLWKNCGKDRSRLVDKIVENPATALAAKFSIHA
jgi:hypothetical protein